jgi:hypothetical protein
LIAAKQFMSAGSSTTPQADLREVPPIHHRWQTWTWFALVLCASVAVVFFFVPAFIIRPFRYQSPRGIWLAMALRQRAPLATIITAIACFVFAFTLWRMVSRWRKASLVLTLILVTFAAVMSRLNYFEWMFHPIDSQEFLTQSESKIDPGEMIMAVRFGGDARAYPIVQMAYHHVLNDVVGSVPVVVTY